MKKEKIQLLLNVLVNHYEKRLLKEHPIAWGMREMRKAWAWGVSIAIKCSQQKPTGIKDGGVVPGGITTGNIVNLPEEQIIIPQSMAKDIVKNHSQGKEINITVNGELLNNIKGVKIEKITET